MKTFKNFLAILPAVCRVSQAGVVHLDIADNGDVAVDIDTKPQDWLSESGGIEADKTASHGAEAQHTAVGTFDVTLPYEIHRGALSDDSSYVNFSNIPFAEPPVGPLRFKAPIPPSWTSQDINEGLEERVCPQYQIGWLPAASDFLECYAGAVAGTCSLKNNFTDPIGPSDYPPWDGSGINYKASEDCLLLDVFVPKSVWDSKNTAKVPVVAWIFGGGYIYGWKSQAGGPQSFFQAAKEQNKDVIYVAMNYRLGAFGWLNGPRFIEEGGTPNAGLHDQRLALSWIQDHIGLFGGDRDSVTVMGQSAGGSSIMHHITAGAGAEAFKPNFSQAILQSPAFFPEGDPYTFDQTYAEFKTRLGADDLDDLQGKGTFDLRLVNAIMTYHSNYGYFRFGPAVDRDYVPRLPGQLLLNNTYHKGIPMILGHTSLDGLLFTPPWIRDDETLRNYMIELYPDLLDETLDTMKDPKYYGIPSGDKTLEINKVNAVVDLLDDIAVSCNNNYLTNAAVQNDSTTPVWRYLFSAKPAIHGSDVLFTYYPTKDVPAFVDPELAHLMQQKYINFALNGNPNGGETPVWPQYQEKLFNYRSVMKFGDLLLGSISSIITDPMKHYRCDLWQPAPFRYSDEIDLSKERSAKNNDPTQRVMSSPLVPQEI